MKVRKLNKGYNVYSALTNNPFHQLANNHAIGIFSLDAIYSFIPKSFKLCFRV